MNAKRPAPPGQRSIVEPSNRRSRVTPTPDQSSQYFPGKIGLVRIRKNAMTPGDVLNAYNSTKATYGL